MSPFEEVMISGQAGLWLRRKEVGGGGYGGGGSGGYPYWLSFDSVLTVSAPEVVNFGRKKYIWKQMTVERCSLRRGHNYIFCVEWMEWQYDQTAVTPHIPVINVIGALL